MVQSLTQGGGGCHRVGPMGGKLDPRRLLIASYEQQEVHSQREDLVWHFGAGAIPEDIAEQVHAVSCKQSSKTLY